MNTADYLLETADDKQVALIENKRRHTYRDLREASARVAAELLHCGVQPGDRIGLLGNNSLFWVAAYLATFKLGAVAVPFATVHAPESIAAQQLRCARASAALSIAPPALVLTSISPSRPWSRWKS